MRRRAIITYRTAYNRTAVHRRGFTFVEMLVTLTIGSLLMVSVVGATRALSSSRESVDRRVARQAAARRAMETIVAALRNVRRDPIRDEPVLVGTRGEGGSQGDRIDLLVINDRRCRPDGAESDQYEVSFSLSQRPGATLPALMCRKDHAFDEYPEDGGLVTLVADGIIGLSFEYLSGEQWLDDWPADEQRVPDAVRVTVAASDTKTMPARNKPNVTALSTVVALGACQPPTKRPGDRAGDSANQGKGQTGTSSDRNRPQEANR